MDGNGRWAGRRGLPRTDGHTEGEASLARLVRVAVTRNIDWLTVFGFSTENWRRPRPEVRHILGLHEKLFGRVAELNDLNVRIQWIGRPFDSSEAKTPKFVQRAIRKAMEDTAQNTGMTLTVCVRLRWACGTRDGGSGSPQAGPRRHVDDRATPLSPRIAASWTYSCGTSGERRVSNFLLWQSAGAAIHFTDTAWPDFDADELDSAIALVG